MRVFAALTPLRAVRRSRAFSVSLPAAAVEIDGFTPEEIVSELDKNIVGQHEAKKSVALALRNRMRRAKLERRLQSEVSPMNIMLIGSTGTGKTEISRRIAKLGVCACVSLSSSAVILFRLVVYYILVMKSCFPYAR